MKKAFLTLGAILAFGIVSAQVNKASTSGTPLNSANNTQNQQRSQIATPNRQANAITRETPASPSAPATNFPAAAAAPSTTSTVTPAAAAASNTSATAAGSGNGNASGTSKTGGNTSGSGTTTTRP